MEILFFIPRQNLFMFYTKSKHKTLTLSLNLSDSFETDFLLNGGIGRLGDVKANRGNPHDIMSPNGTLELWPVTEATSCFPPNPLLVTLSSFQ